MNELDITPYRPEFRDQVISLAVRAWTAVFAKTQNDLPRFVYDAFYPHGWRARQTADVASLLDAEPENVWLALRVNELAGFIGIRIHPNNQMGEIYIVAVSPDRQRQGIGRKLMEFAEQHIRASGMKMVMVETAGDSGHEPARSAYEAFGYEHWPVARYFKPL